MSDVMLYGVLRMPFEMAMSGKMAQFQFHNRAQQCADRLERAEAALERLIAVDDAHTTIHAPDGDDVARMVEYSAAFENARNVIKEAQS